MLPTSGFTVGERLIRTRPPRKELRKISVSLLLTTLMIATPASAFVSSWVGPNTASGTSQSIAGGFQVPGNSTVLDAWLNVGEDGMPSVGNGTGWHSADLPGNMSVGQFNGSTMTHFDETLSLQPNGSFSNIDHFSNSSYYFPMGWTETGGVWGVDGLTGITGNVVNGKRILAHGEIPPSPHGGGISAATSAGTALAAGTNAILTSPAGMTIPSPVLNYSIGFWHWYHLDTPSNTNGNADGAWVEIKLDNGNWTWIEPVGGYGNTISPTVTVPNGAQANGSNGFPAFARVNSSGWQFANFSLDNVSGINTATSIQMRLRVMTMANATIRPGWFIDDIEIFNQGNSTGVWHHGCYVATGTCSYSADAEGILEFPTIDLSSAQSNATVSFLADWDIEGSSWDNWWLEASDDNQTWIDITTPNTNYTLGGWVQPDGIPVQGLIVNGNTYTQDSGGFVAMNFPLPSSFIGDNTTWIRFRVVTDGIVDYGATQDNLEGLIIDNLRVHENNSTYFLEDYFNSSSTVSHYALNSSSNGSTDDWTYRSLGMGYFSNNYGFEDSPALPPGGWQVQNATGNVGWEFGTSIGAGPTNWPSSPAGFGTVVGGSYDSNSWEHLFSPHYTIPAGASASLTFTHWICAESNWDGGAVYISVNNGTWTHFDNTYQNGSSWYDGTITSHTTSPLYNMKVFDGSSRVAAGGWSCNGGGNSVPWVTETADLTNYSGMDVQFRFSFTSDGSVQYEGWYIDDIGVEVDYFDDSGDWTSPAVQPDEHGWGFVDVEAIIPDNTWVTATITDSGNQVIPGYENRTIPVDLAALSPLAYASGIHVKLNLGTDDPFLTPLVSHLQVGSMRFFEPISANNTGWIVPANSGMELNATGYFVNTQGVVNTVEAPFVNSGIPIDGVTIDGNFQGVTITLGSQYNSVMGITNTGSYFLPDVSPGFEVSLDIQPNGWIEWMSFSGNMIAPALNGEVDVTNDGTIDWSFPADPNYGAFGFQDRIAGDNLSNTVDTRSQSLSIGSQNGPNFAGTQNATILNPVQWNGTHYYDVLYVLCGIASCGEITGSFEVYANMIVVGAGASISASAQSWAGTGQGTSTTTASNGAGDGGGGAGHYGAGGAGGGGSSNGGSAYGASTNDSGSSGGNATDASSVTSFGGKGGGTIGLYATTIIINGSVSADGGDGDAGYPPAGGTGPGGHGAGGGSGGAIYGIAESLVVNAGGEITAVGGNGGSGANGAQGGIGIGMYNGGNGGGGGSAGIVRFMTLPQGLTNNGLISLSAGVGASGGTAYGSGVNGANGQSGASGLFINPTNFSGWTSSSISSTTVLLPANANLVAAGLSLYSSAGENLSLSVAGSQVTTITGPWTGVMNVHLSTVDVSAIHSLAGTHSDTTGRLWSEISIALSGDDQVVELSGIKFGYELSENVTSLGQQVKNFHELNNQNGLANSVNIPLEWTADRGGISLGGGVEHELMITNEPFSAPTTFHPTGYNQGFTTGHHHLFDNSEISTVVLTGQASADDIIVTVSDLSTGGTFTQTSGSNMLSIDENSSSVQLVSGSWIVDWQFVVPWSWDDEAQVNWSAQAFNHTGEGLAPATAVSGGSGSQASENDLEIDGFVVRDEFNRLLSNEWDPSYPFYAASQTLVHVSGSVRFQNTPDVRPLVDDFLVSVNVSGTETFINSTDTGEWAGTVSLPNGSGIANISASIVRAGPITGAVGAQDVTTLRDPFYIQLDSNAPSLVALELDTPQGLKPADGFTWDPELPLAVSATVHDSEALGDNVSLYIWREFIDDANTDGHPDSEEYWSVSVDLPAGTVGERQVSFPLIDLTQTITNGNVSLYISGTDWSGHQYADGGMSGYDTDAATLVTAANTATTFSLDSLTLDRVDEYLLAGQTHTLSFALADGNGIHTLDRIDVYLQGQAHTTPSMITIDPRSSTISSASDYITVSEMRITDIGSSSSRFDIDFIIAWDAPDDWDSQWAIPEILVFDDDLVNPTLSIPNLGQIRWILDRDLALVIDDVIDITPPQGISTDDAMYVASGDAVNVFGNLTFAATGHTISELPEGMSAKVYLEYDFQEVSDTVLLSEDGSFSAGIILPSRTISNPVLALNLELFGMPSPAEDLTSQTYTIIVDSEQPTVRFSALASTIDSLILPEYLLTVTLEDDAGIPDQNITVNWEYRRDGSLVMGSQGQVNVSSVASQGETASFSDIVNLDTNDDLKVGDVLLIWVEGHDYAGNTVTGTGTDSDPIAVEVMVREFIITVPSISIGDSNGKPFTGNQATTGTEIAFTVSLRNAGNLAGVVNVSLTESFDDGTWLEHQTIEVTLPESGTRTLEALIFEAYQDGAQRLYVNISGDIDNFTPMISTPGCALVADGLVQCSLSEEVDMPTVISAESVEDESTPLFMVIVAVILSLILFLAVLFYRKNQVDEYAYEEDWEDHTGHVVADMYVESKQTPEIPTADISADAQTLEPQEPNIEPVASEVAVDESQNTEEIVVEENISDASSDDVEQDADATEPSDAVELSDSIESTEEPEPVEWDAEW